MRFFAFSTAPSADWPRRGVSDLYRGETFLMSDEQTRSKPIYKVVINREGQYSIWPVHRDNPLGWSDVGKIGSQEDCCAYIEEVWTDMRPASLSSGIG